MEAFEELKRVVLGNGAFRDSKRVELQNLPKLQELTFGDESVNFCTAFLLKNHPKLETWKLYGSCLNGCCDLMIKGRRGEVEKRADVPELKEVEHTKIQPNDHILKLLHQLLGKTNVSPNVISFIRQYLC